MIEIPEYAWTDIEREIVSAEILTINDEEVLVDVDVEDSLCPECGIELPAHKEKALAFTQVIDGSIDRHRLRDLVERIVEIVENARAKAEERAPSVPVRTRRPRVPSSDRADVPE